MNGTEPTLLEKAQACLDNHHEQEEAGCPGEHLPYTVWEYNFLESVEQQMIAERALSPKQADVINWLYARYKEHYDGQS